MKSIRVDCLRKGIHIKSRLICSKGYVSIGRSPNCDFSIPGASPVHAMLKIKGNELLLMDLGSSIGTVHNKKNVIEERIDQNTSFFIGDFEFRATTIETEVPELGKPETGDTLVTEIITIWRGRIIDTILSEKGGKYDLFEGSVELAVNKDRGFDIPEGFAQISGENDVKQVFQKDDKKIIITLKNKQERIKSKSREKDPLFRKTALASSGVFALLIVISLFIGKKDIEKKEADIMPMKLIKLSLDRIEAIPSGGGGGNPAVANNSKAVKEAVVATKSTIRKYLSRILSNPLASTPVRAAASPIRHNTKKSGLVTLSTKTKKGAGKGSVKLALAGGGSGKGFGGGTGNGIGKGSGNGISNLLSYSIGKAGIALGDEDTMIEGGLSKEIIASIIKKHIGQIRHCYERQLPLNPNLYGKVVMSWTISADGKVSKSRVKSTTMNSSPVEKCMSRKIQGWVFPEPKGGGVVLVTYPFLFKTSSL